MHRRSISTVPYSGPRRCAPASKSWTHSSARPRTSGPGRATSAHPRLVRGADTRDSLIAEDPTRNRDAAEHRLREVAAALETNPVELLRLHAGAGSTGSMTMDLTAARGLSDDVARVLEGRREVERLLGRPAAPELAVTPTPA